MSEISGPIEPSGHVNLAARPRWWRRRYFFIASFASKTCFCLIATSRKGLVSARGVI